MSEEYYRPKDQYNGDEFLTKIIEQFRSESDVLFDLTVIAGNNYLIEAFPQARQHVADPIITSELQGKTVRFYRQAEPGGGGRYIRFAGPGQYHLIRISKFQPTGLTVATELIVAPFQDRQIQILPTLVRFCRGQDSPAVRDFVDSIHNKFNDLAFEKAFVKLEGRIKLSPKDAVEVLHVAHVECAQYGRDVSHRVVNMNQPVEC